MINWDALIGERETVENFDNTPKSGDNPQCLGTDFKKLGPLNPCNCVASVALSPQSPLSPVEKQGKGINTENETRARGVATDNFCDQQTYPVSPIAVSLLLECCRKIEADKQEIIEALLSLRQFRQAEQVQSWALSCSDNGIDPNQLHAPSLSIGEGNECRTCLHLAAGWVQRPGIRRVFRFTCDKWHAILELGYAGERVLIAPPECMDYVSDLK